MKESEILYFKGWNSLLQTPHLNVLSPLIILNYSKVCNNNCNIAIQELFMICSCWDYSVCGICIETHRIFKEPNCLACGQKIEKFLNISSNIKFFGNKSLYNQIHSKFKDLRLHNNYKDLRLNISSNIKFFRI